MIGHFTVIKRFKDIMQYYAQVMQRNGCHLKEL